MSNILAIHRGHGSSCAVMVDGKIIVAAQEERFSKIKNDIGFPEQALRWCLEETEIAAVWNDPLSSVHSFG